MPNTTVWTAGTTPLLAKRWSGRGRPPKLMRRDAKHRPIPVKELALSLPARAWRMIAWREGSADELSSRFTRLRVRVAHSDYNRTESYAEEWLLIEWPKSESAPTKYWLSTLAEKIAFNRLVDLANLQGGAATLGRADRTGVADVQSPIAWVRSYACDTVVPAGPTPPAWRVLIV